MTAANAHLKVTCPCGAEHWLPPLPANATYKKMCQACHQQYAFTPGAPGEAILGSRVAPVVVAERPVMAPASATQLPQVPSGRELRLNPLPDGDGGGWSLEFLLSSGQRNIRVICWIFAGLLAFSALRALFVSPALGLSQLGITIILSAIFYGAFRIRRRTFSSREVVLDRKRIRTEDVVGFNVKPQRLRRFGVRHAILLLTSSETQHFVVSTRDPEEAASFARALSDLLGLKHTSA